MERKNNNTPHWIFYVIAVLLAVIAVFLAVLLLRPTAPGQTAATQNTTAPTAAAEDESTQTTQTTVDAESPGIPLDAKWITLFLPQDLEGVITPRETETENGLRLAFFAAIGQQELELFSVELSKEAREGYCLGVLKNTADGDIFVYTSVNEQPAEAWSGEEFARINQLQERINDLIGQFSEDARFQADR